MLRREMGIEVVVTTSLDSVEGFGLVNVISQENRVQPPGPGDPRWREGEGLHPRLRLRAGLRGGRPEDSVKRPWPGGSVPSETSPLRLAASGWTGSTRPRGLRFFCPDGTYPLGGGMFNATRLGDDGEGIYPHSYERLGVQSGFHVTATLIDPSTGTKRAGAAACFRLSAARAGPDRLAARDDLRQAPRDGDRDRSLSRGDATLRRRLPAHQLHYPGVVGYGGIKFGGNYITESRAVGTTAWRVSAGAVDQDGGELTAIAHCADDRVSLSRSSPPRPRSTRARRVSDHPALSTRAGAGRGGLRASAARTTPSSREGYFTRKGTWATTGYGWFASAELTAYGYCLKARDAVNRAAFPAPRVESGRRPDRGSRVLIYVGFALVASAIAAWIFHRRRRPGRRARPR